MVDLPWNASWWSAVASAPPVRKLGSFGRRKITQGSHKNGWICDILLNECGCGDDEPWGRSPCLELMQVPDRTREPVKFLQTWSRILISMKRSSRILISILILRFCLHFFTMLTICFAIYEIPKFMTIFVTWQLRVTLDSIRNSCDVLICWPTLILRATDFVTYRPF